MVWSTGSFYNAAPFTRVWAGLPLTFRGLRKMQMEALSHPFLSTPSSILHLKGFFLPLSGGYPAGISKFHPLPPKKLSLGTRMCILVICSAPRRATQRIGPHGPGSRPRTIRPWTYQHLDPESTWGTGSAEHLRHRFCWAFPFVPLMGSSPVRPSTGKGVPVAQV